MLGVPQLALPGGATARLGAMITGKKGMPSTFATTGTNNLSPITQHPTGWQGNTPAQMCTRLVRAAAC
jgi:hypothetical protein